MIIIIALFSSIYGYIDIYIIR